MWRQRGTAFLIVMWLLALLAIILGAFALLARSERLQARFLYDSTRARYAAEAGVHRAAFALAMPDPLQRWVPDGRPYRIEFDGAEVEVRIIDESGKLDLNQSDPGVLARFFELHGVEMERAAALAAAVNDWRDADDLITPNGAEDDDYEAAGLDYGSKDAPFDLVSELQQVLGMDYALYQQLAPSLTVFGTGQPEPAFAPLDVLRALPGLDPVLAEQLIAARLAFDPRSGGQPGLMPDGRPLVVSGGSGTYTIVSRARLRSGTWTELDTTIRLGGGGVPASALAFSVLRWQDGALP